MTDQQPAHLGPGLSNTRQDIGQGRDAVPQAECSRKSDDDRRIEAQAPPHRCTVALGAELRRIDAVWIEHEPGWRHARPDELSAQHIGNNHHLFGGAQVDPFDERRRARQVQAAPEAALPQLRAVEL